MKMCGTCRNVLSLRAFGIRPAGQVRSDCRLCDARKSKARYYKRQSKRLIQHREYRKGLSAEEKLQRAQSRAIAVKLRRYKISQGFLDALLVEQNNLCAICERNGRLVIDHSHKTGKVRGLLCYACNLGLGLFRDSAGSLQKAVAYLSPA